MLGYDLEGPADAGLTYVKISVVQTTYRSAADADRSQPVVSQSCSSWDARSGPSVSQRRRPTIGAHRWTTENSRTICSLRRSRRRHGLGIVIAQRARAACLRPRCIRVTEESSSSLVCPRRSCSSSGGARPEKLRRAAARGPVRVVQPRSVVVVRGGYYLADPFWYGYPWYGYGGWYPYQYPVGGYPYPVRYRFAEPDSAVRLEVTPKDAEVFVDGYYAGIVDDFDGVFQRLRVPPGQHEITLYREGYRTVHQTVYLTTRFDVQTPLHDGEARRGRCGRAASGAEEPPADAGARRTASPGTARRSAAAPGRPSPPPPPPNAGNQRGGDVSSYGTLAIRVQPANATVTIDGERWDGPQGQDRLLVELSEGPHRVEIQRDGFEAFPTTITSVGARRRRSTSACGRDRPRPTIMSTLGQTSTRSSCAVVDACSIPPCCVGANRAGAGSPHPGSHDARAGGEWLSGRAGSQGHASGPADVGTGRRLRRLAQRPDIFHRRRRVLDGQSFTRSRAGVRRPGPRRDAAIRSHREFWRKGSVGGRPGDAGSRRSRSSTIATGGFDGPLTPQHVVFPPIVSNVRVREEFWVAEPEAHVLVRFSRHVHLAAGASYRFVGRDRGTRDGLNGPSGSIALQIG